MQSYPYYGLPPVQRYGSPFSMASSAVSTPAITPPLVPMLDSMLAHHPAWLSAHHYLNQESIIAKIAELQSQTTQLVGLLRQPQQQVQYTPAYVAPPSPAIPTTYAPSNEAYLAAQAVLDSVPRASQMEESVLARAVVAAAQALVGNRTGFVADLRQPEAVRAQTPAWLNQVACAGPDESNNVGSIFFKAAESPAPAPEFGSQELKSPSTVMKCARGLEYKE